MPLFRLSNDLIFPPAQFARPDGLLCIGGDLSPDRLLLAYQNGIFPWFSKDDPLLWWSPDPRLVLFPDNIHVSKSLKKTIRRSGFKVRINTAFKPTIQACAKLRQNDDCGTWLLDEMIDAYIMLHRLGAAHSVETWLDGTLVGGLYGIGMGKSFFGESMFSLQADASKVALVALSNYLNRFGFDLIDCQVTSDHMLSMGAEEISRPAFLDILSTSVSQIVPEDIWTSKQIQCNGLTKAMD